MAVFADPVKLAAVLKRLLLVAVFLIPSAALVWLEVHSSRQLAALESSWTADARQLQQEGLSAATRSFATLERDLTERLQTAIADPAVSAAATDDALRAAIARRPPAQAPDGFELRDESGTCLAWSGTTTQAPTVFGNQLSVVVTNDRTGPVLVLGQKVLLAGRPLYFRIFHPLTAGLLGQHPSNDFQAAVAAEYGRSISITFGQTDPNPDGLSQLLRSRTGVTVGQAVVPPVSLEAEKQRLALEADLLSLALRGLLLLMASGMIALRLFHRQMPSGVRFLLLTGVIAGTTLLLLRVDLTRLLPAEQIVGPTYYSDINLGVFARSPITLLVTLIGLLLVALAAHTLLAPAEQPPPPDPKNTALALLAGTGAGGLVWLFIRATYNLVTNSSSVDFFPAMQVTPEWPVLLLQAALFLLALTVLLGTDLLLARTRWWLGGLGQPVAWAGALLTLMLVVAGIGLLGGWPTGYRLPVYLVSLVWFCALMLVLLREYRWVARALVVLLAAGAMAYPTLARAIHDDLLADAIHEANRFDWEQEAGKRVARAGKLELAADEMASTLQQAWANPQKGDLAFALWAALRESDPKVSLHCHLRIFEPNGVQLGQFKLNMPPWRWYSRQLLALEKAPQSTTGTARIQLRRDRSDLELHTTIREVTTLSGKLIRLSLTLPFREDRFRPQTPVPGMFNLGPRPPESRLFHILWDGKGGVRSSLGAIARNLPRPEASSSKLDLRIGDREATMVLLAGPEQTPHAGKLAAIGVLRSTAATTFLNYVRLLLTFLSFALLLLPSGLLPALARRGEGLLMLGTERRIIGAILVLSFLPLLWLAGLSHQRARTWIQQSTVRDLSRALGSLGSVVVDRCSGGELQANLLDDGWCREVSDELGRIFYIYKDGALLATSHPELVRIGLVPRRPPIEVDQVLSSHRVSERIGTLQLSNRSVPVGYAPMFGDGGQIVGIIGTPALAEHSAQQAVLVRSTLLLIAVYGLVLLAVVLCGLLLARWISRPVEKLLEGTRQVASGNLEYRIDYTAANEFGELVCSFNQMTHDLLLSQERALDDERSEAFRTMARQIAHEIKNPLTPMKLATQHLRDAYQQDHPKLPEIIEKGTHTLIEQIEALRRIATEFSAFAKFPRRRFEIVELESLLEEVCQMYDDFEGRIRVIRRMGQTPSPVRVDRDELRRVFINLFNNAVQAIKQEGILVVVTERTHLAPVTIPDGRSRARPFVDTKLIDNGPGIPEDLLTKIFRPNFSTRTAGTGLGLAICKKSITELGGEISIQSEEGEGSTVSVVLPVHVDDEPSA